MKDLESVVADRTKMSPAVYDYAQIKMVCCVAQMYTFDWHKGNWLRNELPLMKQT